MRRLGTLFAVASLVAVTSSALAASRPLAGTWRKLPAAPTVIEESLTAVWTGRQMIVFGRSGQPAANNAEAYDPARTAWRRLAPPPGQEGSFATSSLWTGKQMLIWGRGTNLAYDPAIGTWSPLRRSLPNGRVVWTGREAIGWGGGCCGDAWSKGAAYNPATGRFRTLPRSPLAPSQRPVGAWTGRRLLLFVSGFNPDGRRYPARLARGAAYDPARNAWRRLPSMPGLGGVAVWDGRELLVVGGGVHDRSAFAYSPKHNRWRRLAAVPRGRAGASAVWTGRRLLLWGGDDWATGKAARSGFAYDPRTNRWSSIPRAPLRARSGAVAVWAKRALIVWGGEIGTPVGTSIPPRHLRDGAIFVPVRP